VLRFDVARARTTNIASPPLPAKSLSCIDYPLPLFVPTEKRRPRWSMRLVDDKDGFTLHCPIAQRRECSQRIAPAGF
jgi:hypothetical protein